MERRKTAFTGVYERKGEVRKLKNKPDICYDITYKADGKLVWEKIGWQSEGYSAVLASQIRSERLRSIRHGQDLPKDKKKAPFLKDIAKRYLDWAQENKNRKGVEDRSRYENHLKLRFEEKRLNEITTLDLERMKVELAKAGYSPSTITHCLALMRQMFNKARDWGLYVGENPVTKVKKPVIKNQRQRFLSFDEAAALLAALRQNTRRKKNPGELKDTKLHDIAVISLHTGARAGEVFNLRGQDVDFETSLLAFVDTKNNETRHAIMTETVREILSRRMPTAPQAYIFTDRQGRKIKEVSNAFENIVDDLGLNAGVTDPRRKITFHSLRHTFASWLALRGETIQTIAELLGHKTLQMTMRYSHLTKDHKRRAVLGLEEDFVRSKNKVKPQPASS